MFTQTCFIRKNTKELQDKLSKLGYEENTYASMKYSCLCADNYEDGYYDGESWQKTSDIPYYESIKPEDYNPQDYGIDCGTNEDLFLAIASLRDDSNINQWFTNGEDWGIYEEHVFEGKKYTTFNFVNLPHDTKFNMYHKASLDEIIEHFKNK